MEMFFHFFFKKYLIVYLFGCAASYLQHIGALVVACGI